MHVCATCASNKYTTLHHDCRLGDAFIRDEQRQTGGQDPALVRRQNVDEVDMTDTIASSGLKSLGPDKTMNS